MPTAYEKVLAKYEWAKQHVDQLESAIDEFRRSNPHSIGIERNLERNEITFHVIAVPPIPDRIGFMLGDAIHNLRSTLDHLAWGLVSKAGGTLDEHTSFPIGTLAKDFKSVLGSRVKGLGKYCLEAIERIQPYKNGWGHWAWQLHQLDIVDKHQLVPTVTTIPIGRTMTPSEKEAFHRRKSLIGPNTHAALQFARAVASPSIAPMEAGYVLGTFPLSEVQENMGFSFDIAINQPGIAELIPISWLTRTFLSEVSTVISELNRFL